MWGLLVNERSGIPWQDYNPWSLSAWQGSLASLATQIILSVLGLCGLCAVLAWVGYAFVSGRNIKQRLTDPAEIVL